MKLTNRLTHIPFKWIPWDAENVKKHGRTISVVLSGILIAAAWLLTNTSSFISVTLYVLAYLIGGFATAKEAVLTLFEEREIDVNLLMILSAVGAGFIGHWSEGAILIFIFALSGALEQYTTAKSSKDVESLMKLKPKQATMIENGVEIAIDIEKLQVGDLIVVKPGELIAADGKVTKGSSSVNQASITGESVPVDKVQGNEVFAGTLNGEGAIVVEVLKTNDESLFSKIIRLVQEAQSEMPASQRFIERFEKVYAKIVIGATLLFIFLPPLLLSWDWNDTFYRAMVFMVVASPCALVASTMPAMLSAISNGARKGLIFKGGVHLEEMADVKLIVFDKTGTLTTGKMSVSDVVSFNGMQQEEIVSVSASLENLSKHPIAKAIVAHADSLSVSFTRPEDFRSVTGNGLQGRLHDVNWRIGKPSFIEPAAMNEEAVRAIEQFESQGKTVIVLQDDNEVKGVIALQDKVKPEMIHTIALLKKQGIQSAMLTGDQKKTAQNVANEAGIDLVYSELMPDDKANIVKDLREKFGNIAMVGDGVNDAPALATANVGIAMGAAGSDAALETADIVLMNDDIANIPYTVKLGKKLKKIVLQNVIFSIAVICFLVISNFAVGVSLPLGVIGHEGSTIIVILNGLRLLRKLN